jgi:hypothetical protein
MGVEDRPLGTTARRELRRQARALAAGTLVAIVALVIWALAVPATTGSAASTEDLLRILDAERPLTTWAGLIAFGVTILGTAGWYWLAEHGSFGDIGASFALPSSTARRWDAALRVVFWFGLVTLWWSQGIWPTRVDAGGMIAAVPANAARHSIGVIAFASLVLVLRGFAQEWAEHATHSKGEVSSSARTS